jgi:tRNA (guanine-N7-)-methyltransferase
MAADPATLRRLYGRRQGYALRQGQAARVERMLPGLSVPDDGQLSAARLFGDDRPLWLEVGFGAGEHLAFQAGRNPGIGVIGCEPFLNGVVSLLRHVETAGLANVRVHMGDALDVLDRLPDASLERLFVLHPDPWPKARHAKRRFVNPGPMALAAAKLRPDGELRIATDHPLYLRWALMVMRGQTGFRWTAERPEDWRDVPEDWPDTRYAAKARALGHEVWRLRYIRV